MERVASSDGTQIAFERSGNGPSLVLVHGTTADHTRWRSVLPDFEQSFMVLAMNRRGRGASGDALDYSLTREFDNVVAVLRVAGDGASLVGHFFGAFCAMEAALRVDTLARIVLYEPAFPPNDIPIYEPGARERFQTSLDTGNREALLETFFREIVGMDDEGIAKLRDDPSWAGRLLAEYTLVREMEEDNYHFDPARFRGLKVPTLLIMGETSPVFLQDATRLLDAALPDSRIVILPGPGYVAINTAPELFTREVLAFLTA